MHVLQIGCGALGALLAQATLNEGHRLTIVRRSASAVPPHANGIRADVTRPDDLQPLRQVSADILLYCLAPSASHVLAYEETYLHGLKNVLAQLNLSTFKHVFFISSTRVYGASDGAWLDDNSPAIPADACGQALFDAEQLLQALPCGHTALRISGIYGPQRRYLLRMAQSPESWPKHALWSNRIHEQDVVGAILHLYGMLAQGQPLPAQLLLTDGVPTLQHEVIQWIAQRQGWPLPTTPPLQPESGKRLRNTGLQLTGYRLHYADYQAGYDAILRNL